MTREVFSLSRETPHVVEDQELASSPVSLGALQATLGNMVHTHFTHAINLHVKALPTRTHAPSFSQRKGINLHE